MAEVRVNRSPCASPSTPSHHYHYRSASLRPVKVILDSSNCTSSTSLVLSTPLELVLNSVKFPEIYHEPVWRILDATERIKRLLKIKDTSDDSLAGPGAPQQRKGVDVRGVWMQLEIIGDVLFRLATDVKLALAHNTQFVKATHKPGLAEKVEDLSLLFELLNLDDVLKGMYHLPSYALVIQNTLISHLTNLKLLLLRHIPMTPTPYAGNALSSSGSSIHSFTPNISPAELVELLTQHINTVHQVIETIGSILSINDCISSQHKQVSRRLQSVVISNIQKESKPTRECLKNLAAALKIVRSVTFPPELGTNPESPKVVTVEEMQVHNDLFYQGLLPLLKKATTYIKRIDELGLSRNMNTNKDMVLPFYLELVRYTRGTVDESPLSKLGSERGLGVGYGGTMETPLIERLRSGSAGAGAGGQARQLGRRVSLSAGSMLGIGGGGLKEELKGWMKRLDEQEGKKKIGGLKGIWARLGGTTKTPKLPPSSSPLPYDSSKLAPNEEGKYSALKRKQRSAHLSHSFHSLSLSSVSTLIPNQHGSTDSFGTALSSTTTRSGYGGSRDGREGKLRKERWISDAHKSAQDEWEEFAMMVNVQKCMCKTGWMVGGVQHLRSREGLSKSLVFGV